MDSDKVERHGMMVDLISYQLGKIFTFSEIIGAGVKDLALSPPLVPDEMNQLIGAAEEIAREFNISIYLEKDILTTDLFDEAFTKGKQVLLIYKDPRIKERYLALKARKAGLVDDGTYHGEMRKEIAREMGRLLSYEEDHIEQMLITGPSAPE